MAVTRETFTSEARCAKHEPLQGRSCAAPLVQVEVEADSESEAESIALKRKSDWKEGGHESVEEVEEITQLPAHGLTY